MQQHVKIIKGSEYFPKALYFLMSGLNLYWTVLAAFAVHDIKVVQVAAVLACWGRCNCPLVTANPTSVPTDKMIL